MFTIKEGSREAEAVGTMDQGEAELTVLAPLFHLLPLNGCCPLPNFRKWGAMGKASSDEAHK